MEVVFPIFKIPLFEKLKKRHYNMNRRSDKDAKGKKPYLNRFILIFR